ncbi:ARABIDOPSIS THALIANA LIPID TRANSFER PROTEIN 1, lipid transfer protein 1, LIPID TRANSFER PROTEIN 1 [Hibiscus trionum]|uniref:ARABIDOPSIS THALIANA LIPID TRANSFER PROTEIN 1, lipid transfer protein 1, LIPID TRANSFER PROTEIN 1 n=1 Tax=Hibiscus trionum TaxID=183268 RepID=A0A9W7MR82_HIBTR|nr:ARABIDOPSIS THALIANA LIPID TRANSFER PROTEIN 1, lipid transfer protein 1, LIPID TRANSFER PROTEIN 1 [Hibiscus trionum]
MASSMSLKLAYLVVLCLVMGAPLPQGARKCGQVTSSLEPSIPWLTSGGEVQPSSCSRIKSLNAATQATPDLQVACNCLKSAADSYVALIRIRGRG